MAEREGRLKKIQALLDKAESTGFTEEAQACREKADQLMVSWAVEQWELDKVKPRHEREKPVRRDMRLFGPNNNLAENLVDLFVSLARHTRCRAVYSGLRDPKRWGVTAQCVGFESDLDYLEMMYTSLHVQLSNGLQPKPDPNFTYDENIALLKNAGMKWADIHRIMHPEDGEFDRSKGPRLIGAYKRWVAANPDAEYNYASPITYQRNYAAGFQTEVSNRLMQIRLATKRQQENESTSGTMDLALRDRDADVTDLFQNEFPSVSMVKAKGPGKFDPSARRRGQEQGAKADLGQTRVSSTKAIG